ncbi:hypothetical protein ACVIJ6_002391 [Bradyrhizobium sp. USDA 4369]
MAESFDVCCHIPNGATIDGMAALPIIEAPDVGLKLFRDGNASLIGLILYFLQITLPQRISSRSKSFFAVTFPLRENRQGEFLGISIDKLVTNVAQEDWVIESTSLVFAETLIKTRSARAFSFDVTGLADQSSVGVHQNGIASRLRA